MITIKKYFKTDIAQSYSLLPSQSYKAACIVCTFVMNEEHKMFCENI